MSIHNILVPNNLKIYGNSLDLSNEYIFSTNGHVTYVTGSGIIQVGPSEGIIRFSKISSLLVLNIIGPLVDNSDLNVPGYFEIDVSSVPDEFLPNTLLTGYDVPIIVVDTDLTGPIYGIKYAGYLSFNVSLKVFKVRKAGVDHGYFVGTNAHTGGFIGLEAATVTYPSA